MNTLTKPVKGASPHMPEINKLPPELKVLMIVIERNNMAKLEDFLRDKHIRFHYMINAVGTARSEVLKSLGLSGSEKTVCVCVIRNAEADRLVSSVTDRFSLTKPGNGIIYTLPVSGISAVMMELLNDENSERSEHRMENLSEEKKSGTSYSLVVSVVNHGYSEVLMNAARSAGARGGTIINARHSGIGEAVKFFGVTLQAEKEIVAIVLPSAQKSELVKMISQKCGLHTEAHGITITLPVENCAGIDME